MFSSLLFIYSFHILLIIPLFISYVVCVGQLLVLLLVSTRLLVCSVLLLLVVIVGRVDCCACSYHDYYYYEIFTSFDCFALLVCFLSCYSSKVVVPVAELAVCGVRGGGVVSRGVRTL
jgi:hypothetical protein